MRLVFAASRRAMVLPLVLIVIALLSLSAYTFSELMLTEYTAAVVNERQAQARYLADCVEYLADFVSQLDDVQLQNGGRYHNPGFFQGNLVIDGNGLATGAGSRSWFPISRTASWPESATASRTNRRE